MSRRRVATLGRLSMAAGSALMVVELSIGAGVLGVAGGGPSSSVVPSPTAMALAATPASAVSVEPMLMVFEDSFEFEGAWPTGDLGGLTAAYDAGQYVISGPGADLPLFIAPVAEPLASASTVVVEAELSLGPGARAGIYVGGGDAERIAALISSDGRVTILRDSSVSLDVIGSGSVATDGSVRLTLTLDGGRVSVAVDGQPALSVAVPATALDFGLVTWPTRDSALSMSRFHVAASTSG